MQMNKNDATNQEVLEAISKFSSSVDERFNKIDERFEKNDRKFISIDERFDRVESQMVTKHYLDEKLSNLRGDLVVLTRKEDNKLKTLIDILANKKVLNEEDKKKLFALEPFSI